MQIMRLLHAVVESEGVTALVATHDPNLISIADSVLELQDGQIKGNWSERSAVRADHGPLPPFRRGAGARSCARPAAAHHRGQVPRPGRGNCPRSCADYATGVPVVAMRSANREMRRLVTGPGVPSPMTRPSTRRTGTTPPMVPVTNTSAAV